MIILSLVSLFLVAGIVGGYAGYLQGPPIPDDLPVEKRSSQRSRSIVLGIVAHILVPVFLTIVRATSGNDDDLIDQLASQETGVSGWFVLFGFALLAAISAQKLISNLTKKLFDDVLERATAAEKLANVTQEDLEDLGEDVADMAAAGAMPASRSASRAQPLSAFSTNVLETIYRAPERRPTKVQIAQAGRFNENELDAALRDLESRGLVRSKDYEGTIGWRVRTTGKALLASRQLPMPEPDSDT